MIINLNALGLSSKADLEARVELIISISTVDLYHGAVHAARTAIVVLKWACHTTTPTHTCHHAITSTINLPAMTTIHAKAYFTCMYFDL